MQQCLRQRPADSELRFSLVSHLQKAGRYDEAIREAQDLLQRNPADRRVKGLLRELRLEQRLAAMGVGFR